MSLAGRAWHGDSPTGTDFWRGGKDANARSIGIEIANFGRLTHRNGRWCREGIDKARRKILVPIPDQSRVEVVDGQGWHKYTSEQIQAVLGLCVRLASLFPQLLDGADRFAGHSQIDPTRKVDPGPLFPWLRLRAALEAMRQGIMPDLLS